jgi:hypothetical protein
VEPRPAAPPCPRASMALVVSQLARFAPEFVGVVVFDGGVACMRGRAGRRWGRCQINHLAGNSHCIVPKRRTCGIYW